MLTINVFQAFNGDCIGISFIGDDQKNHHIVIDAGYSGSFMRTLCGFCDGIKVVKEKIDLFVITHTDEDHIQGMSNFIKRYDVKKLVEQFWFNWSHLSYPIQIHTSDRVSITQGIDLRDHLWETGLLNQHLIHDEIVHEIYGLKITVLSPNQKKFERFRKKWDDKERKVLEKESSIKMGASANDYKCSIKDLVAKKFVSDNAPANGSSIAFLLEYHTFKVLFLADSHPSTIVKSLKKKGYSKKNKLKIDYLKVSHHGAKGNTSPALLELIDCQNYIISCNGINRNNHPTKEALSRIVHSNYLFTGQGTHIYFNHPLRSYPAIFSKNEIDQYNIKCHYANLPNRIELTFTV